MKRALVPGSFDPFTLGHLDLVLRSARLFDETVVCGFYNISKNYTFDADTRLAMLRNVCEAYSEKDGMGKITADVNDGLLAEYCEKHDISVIVKGARSTTDFDYEYTLAAVNRQLCPSCETIFLPAKAEYQHISSTVVRDMIKYGRDLTGYVPKEILKYFERS